MAQMIGGTTEFHKFCTLTEVANALMATGVRVNKTQGNEGSQPFLRQSGILYKYLVVMVSQLNIHFIERHDKPDPAACRRDVPPVR